MADDPSDRAIPKSRLARSAKLGMRAGAEGVRFAGTKATGAVRSKEKRRERMDETALASAERLVDTLGAMKGVAMKMGQLASFIDTDYLPEEYRELYQEKLAALRTTAPAMPWEKVRRVLEQEFDEPYEELFERIEPEAFAAASIGQVHRGTLHDGREVAVKIQYPGIDSAIRADLSNAGMILRLTKALAPGLDAKAVADELRERVLEELDYEHEAQNQRSFARAYRGPSVHPRARRRDATLAQPGARHRIRPGDRIRGREADGRRGAQPLRGDRVPLLPRARSTSCTTSTPTRTPATTC